MKTSIIIASFALGTTLLATGCDHLPGSTAGLLAKASQLKDQLGHDPRVQALLDGRMPPGMMQQLGQWADQADQNGFNDGDQARGWDAQPQNGWNNQQPQNGWNNQQDNGWNNQQPQNGWNNQQDNGWNNQQDNGWNVQPQNGWDNPTVYPAQGFDPAAFQQQQAMNQQGFDRYMQGIQADSNRRAQAVESWTNTVIRGE